MGLPGPPKLGAGALIPGIILLLVGIVGPVLEIYDRQKHPLDVRTVTVIDHHRERVGRTGSGQSHSVRMCDFRLPDGATEDVRCSMTQGTGDTIKVYQGDNSVWQAYETDLHWLVRGAIFTLLGIAYVGFWLWARAHHKRRKAQRAR